MNGFGLIIIGVIVLGALLTIGSVGKEREPISPSVAVVTIILDALLIWVVVLAVAA